MLHPNKSNIWWEKYDALVPLFFFLFCNYFTSFSATRKLIYMQWTERQAILKLMATRSLEVIIN